MPQNERNDGNPEQNTTTGTIIIWLMFFMKSEEKKDLWKFEQFSSLGRKNHVQLYNGMSIRQIIEYLEFLDKRNFIYLLYWNKMKSKVRSKIVR